MVSCFPQHPTLSSASLRTVLVALLCTGLCWKAVAHEHMEEVVVRATSGEVLAYGPFRSKGAQRASGATEYAVIAENVRDANFVDINDQIVARPGEEFGIRYKLHGPPHAATMVEAVIHFPRKGIMLSGGQRYKKSTERFKVRYNEAKLYGYGYDEPGEMVPGEWTFEIFAAGRLAVSRTFHVRLPD